MSETIPEGSEVLPEITEAIEKPIKADGRKVPRTPAQLEVLTRARAKAQETIKARKEKKSLEKAVVEPEQVIEPEPYIERETEQFIEPLEKPKKFRYEEGFWILN
jgi:hypothetical protein